MEISEIRELCIQATERYLAWLREKDLGYVVIPVIGIELGDEGVHLLTLGGKLFDPDNVIVEDRRNQRRFGAGDITVQTYDSDRNLLVIKFHDPNVDFGHVAAGDVFVISDLKFLVDNVRKWYVEKGLQLTASHRLPSPQVGLLGSFAIPPLGSQPKAIELVASSPASYVWGCPGTGKTRCVLANMVLSYVRAGKRVGIFAPTNNALEQVFAGLLEALGSDPQVDRKRFLRVGTPSRKFAERFPEVCEVQGLQKRINEAEQQVSNLQMVLECRRGRLVLNSAENLLGELHSLEGLLDQRKKLALAKQDKVKQIEEFERESSRLLTKLGDLLAHRRRQRLKELERLKRELASLEQQLCDVEAEADGCMATIRRTSTQSDRLNGKMQRVTFQTLAATRKQIEELIKETVAFIETKRLLAEQYKDASDEELSRLVREHEDLLRELKRQTLEQRLEGALVVGMTLDAYIGRLRDAPLHFDHVFLDEAAYAPLIKALTLFRQGVPVTFLGDHKQLPPVCEMNSDDFTVPRHQSVIIWRKSAMFCDAMFKLSQDDFLSSCLHTDDPPWPNTKQADLTETHRFGQNLTDILSCCVYDGKPLISVAEHGELNIKVIDAPLRQPPANRRENLSECTAIRQYLEEMQSSEKQGDEAYVILTPYKKQVALLYHTIPTVRRERGAMVIHKSQGREWETVLLSVVDGPWNRPWFTDSRRSESLRVLNTAVSRARKNLVIVCNRDYWEQHPEQLITRLIRLAT